MNLIHPILYGLLIAIGAFIVTWVIGFSLRLVHAPVELDRRAKAAIVELTAKLGIQLTDEEKENKRRRTIGTLARLAQEGQGVVNGSFSYLHPHTDPAEWRKRVAEACRDEFPHIVEELEAVRRLHLPQVGDIGAYNREVGAFGEIVTLLRR